MPCRIRLHACSAVMQISNGSENAWGRSAGLLLGPAWHDLDLAVDRGDGQPLDPDTFTHQFERIAARAGIVGANLHSLRHAYATTMLVSGVHPKVVSEALGHANVAFTMSVYQHVLPTMGEQAAAAIEKALGGKQGWIGS